MPAGGSVKRGAAGADDKGRFWERLITDWVAVAVAAFVVQGLWFGLTDLLASQRPDLAPSLAGLSARVGPLWLLAFAIGLAWGVKRARDARHEALSRGGTARPV